MIFLCGHRVEPSLALLAKVSSRPHAITLPTREYGRPRVAEEARISPEPSSRVDIVKNYSS